jgi:hypothetical protein
MEKTLILVPTHRGISPETAECIGALKCPSIIRVRGRADVVKARCEAFDAAIEHTQGTPIDTVLCLDDDMVFQPPAALELVAISRRLNEPVSGVALTENGVISAMPWRPNSFTLSDRPRWLTGLACMAVPIERLRKLAKQLDDAREGRTLGAPAPSMAHWASASAFPPGIRRWCDSGEHPERPGEWTSEDLWFCLQFAGVLLAGVGFGHLKWVPLYPEDAVLKQLPRL